MVTVKIEKDENGELVLPLNEEMCKELGWKIGDVVVWKDNMDGTFSITKKEQITNKNKKKSS